jgi:AcrR family transcriptional regulator
VNYNDYKNLFGQKGRKIEMPKCYSDREKDYIKKRLKEEAAKCLSQYGIKKTTVDEIVKRVKIPKGSFYLFYQSKELLLFEVILEQHDFIEKKLMEEISSIGAENFTAESLTEVIMNFYRMAEEMPILKLLSSDEVELLARKLPQEILEEHLSYDHSNVDKLFEAFPQKKKIDTKVISAAFRAIYFSTLHKEEIGEESFDDALRLMVSGIVNQLI